MLIRNNQTWPWDSFRDCSMVDVSRWPQMSEIKRTTFVSLEQSSAWDLTATVGVSHQKLSFYYQLNKKSTVCVSFILKMRPQKSDQSHKLRNRWFTNVSVLEKRDKADCHKLPTKATIETLTCVHKSLMGWNSIVLNLLPLAWKKKTETEQLSSEISHLLCRLKEAEMNKNDEKRGRRESSKDLRWIRSIKMKLNELTRAEGSKTDGAQN